MSFPVVAPVTLFFDAAPTPTAPVDPYEGQPSGGFKGSILTLTPVWGPFVSFPTLTSAAPHSAPIPTTFDAILAAFRSRLVAAALATPESVVITLEEEPTPSSSGTRYLIGPGDSAADSGSFVATGRAGLVIRSVVVVQVVDEALLDFAGADTLRLTAGPGNLLARAQASIDALHEKFLMDDARRPLTVEPISVTHMSRPHRYATSAAYARVELDFDVAWQMKLSATDDPYA